MPGSGSFPEQIDRGVLITRIPYGSVAENASPSQPPRLPIAPLIPFGLLATAVLIIFAFALDGDKRIQHVSLD